MLFRTRFPPIGQVTLPTLGVVAVLQEAHNEPNVGYGKYTLYLTGQTIFPTVEINRPTDHRVSQYTQIATSAKKPGPIPWPVIAFGPFPFRKATMRSLYNAARLPEERNRLIRSAMGSFFAPAHIRPTQEETLRWLTSADTVTRENDTYTLVQPLLSSAATAYIVSTSLKTGTCLSKGNIVMPVTLYKKIIAHVFFEYVMGIAAVAAETSPGGWVDSFAHSTATATGSLAAHLAHIAHISIRCDAPRERKRSWAHKLKPHRRIYTIAKCTSKTAASVLPCPHSSASDQNAFCGATTTSTPADVWARAALAADTETPIGTRLKMAARWVPPCIKSFNTAKHQNDKARFETANVVNKVASMIEESSHTTRASW